MPRWWPRWGATCGAVRSRLDPRRGLTARVRPGTLRTMRSLSRRQVVLLPIALPAGLAACPFTRTNRTCLRLRPRQQQQLSHSRFPRPRVYPQRNTPTRGGATGVGGRAAAGTEGSDRSACHCAEGWVQIPEPHAYSDFNSWKNGDSETPARAVRSSGQDIVSTVADRRRVAPSPRCGRPRAGATLRYGEGLPRGSGPS